jgi:hypothetical protein
MARLLLLKWRKSLESLAERVDFDFPIIYEEAAVPGTPSFAIPSNQQQ